MLNTYFVWSTYVTNYIIALKLLGRFREIPLWQLQGIKKEKSFIHLGTQITITTVQLTQFLKMESTAECPNGIYSSTA